MPAGPISPKITSPTQPMSTPSQTPPVSASSTPAQIQHTDSLQSVAAALYAQSDNRQPAGSTVNSLSGYLLNSAPGDGRAERINDLNAAIDQLKLPGNESAAHGSAVKDAAKRLVSQVGAALTGSASASSSSASQPAPSATSSLAGPTPPSPTSPEAGPTPPSSTRPAASPKP